MPPTCHSMKTTHLLILAVLATASLFSIGCTGTRTWDPDNAPATNANGVTKRIVIFAPVDASLVHEEYPAANMELARSMAQRTDLIANSVESWVGETLPISSSPQWDQGPIGATSGAHNVVLTQLINIERTRPLGPNPGRVIATVRMRVFNVAGQQLWANEFRGFADDETTVRTMADSAQPVAKAAWDACDTGVWGLKRWLDSVGLPNSRNDFAAPVLDEPALIDVTISSIPENADIFVDGIFRGTTPTVVPLPVQMMSVRIERAGYVPWEREVRPSPEMRIQPALQPTQGSEPAGNALPLPSEQPVAPTVDSDPSAVTTPPPRQAPVVEEPADEGEDEPAVEEVDEAPPVRSSEAGPAPVEELRGVDLPPVE